MTRYNVFSLITGATKSAHRPAMVDVESALERMRAMLKKRGAEGLQQWMDKHGLGTDVMTAKDAMEKREKAKVANKGL